MVAASRNESPSHVDVRQSVRAQLESLAHEKKKAAGLSWTEMVAASRAESPAPVEIRYGVRAELESLLRSGQACEEADWTNGIIRLFSPVFAKVGVTVAFICMLVLASTTSVLDSEFDSGYADPLVTLNSLNSETENEWSDWL